MPRPPTPVKRYHQSLLETMSDIGRHQKWFTSPLNLGGVPGPSGGEGIPIGGLIGQLIQSKVAYDTTEAEILNPPASGLSLVDNLNTMRFRLLFLEDHSSSALIVKEEGVQRASGVVIMNFQGGVNVTSPQPNTVNVIVTATGGGSVLGGVTVVFEDLTSQIPAMDDFYVVSQTIVSGSSQVFMNGLHQIPTYYTETTSGVKLTETLTATDELLIQYLTSGATAVGLKIFDTGIFQASGVTELNFIGAESITVSGTRVNITFSGGAGGGGDHTLGSATHTDVVITSEGDNDILAYDSGSTDWINQTAAEANLATTGHTHSDVVDVSADDTTAGFLEDKIVAGNNIEITVLNEAGDEDLQIAASGLSISGHVHVEADITDLLHDTVLVSSNDTTEGFLEDKIVAGANITLTTLDEGANETLEITSTGSGGGSALEVQDEGITLTSGVTLLDFVGGGVTATAVGNAVTVTIPSGAGGGEIDFGDWQDGALEWFANESQATLDSNSFTKFSHVGRTVHVIAYLQSDTGSLTGTFQLRNLPVPVDGSLQVGVAPLGLVRHKDEGAAFRDLYPQVDATTKTTVTLQRLDNFATYSDTIDIDDSMTVNLTYYAASGTTVPGGGGSPINIDDEGVNIASGVTNLDFVGGGVTATASGTSVTVTIPSGTGGGSPLVVNSGTFYTETVLYDEILTTTSGSLTARNISQDYDAILIRTTLRSDKSSIDESLAMWFNGDTTNANYRGGGGFHGTTDGNLNADSTFWGGAPAASSQTDVFSEGEILIKNYSLTTIQKTALFRNSQRRDATNMYFHAGGIQWENTAAINKVSIVPLSGDNFIALSRIQVIGIRNEVLITGVSGGTGGGEFSYFSLDKPKPAADTPDDEFSESTLDGKWTVVSGSSGTVDLLETANVSKYDLTTRPGNLLMQVGQTGAQEVSFRQDYTLPDGKSIIVAVTPTLLADADGGGINNNEIQLGISLNPSDTDHGDGDEQEVFFDANANGWRVFHAANALAVGATPNSAMPDMQRMYLRITRAGSVYYAFYSMDGQGWAPLGSHTPGATQTNVWIWTRSSASFGDPIPIQVFDWIRLGTNGLDPWDTALTVRLVGE